MDVLFSPAVIDRPTQPFISTSISCLFPVLLHFFIDEVHLYLDALAKYSPHSSLLAFHARESSFFLMGSHQ